MLDRLAFLRRVYERFNARDIDGVPACLPADVVWANDQDGGYAGPRWRAPLLAGKGR